MIPVNDLFKVKDKPENKEKEQINEESENHSCPEGQRWCNKRGKCVPK